MYNDIIISIGYHVIMNSSAFCDLWKQVVLIVLKIRRVQIIESFQNITSDFTIKLIMKCMSKFI